MEEVKCLDCGKSLSSEESLMQHSQARHKKSKGRQLSVAGKAKATKKHFVSAIIILVVLASSFWVYSSATSPGKYDDFAKCLTKEDVTFYGAFWCSHCADQKALFGKSMEYVNYVECSTSDRRRQTVACIDANIESYPTWEFQDGNRREGFVSLEQLSVESGCNLKGE